MTTWIAILVRIVGSEKHAFPSWSYPENCPTVSTTLHGKILSTVGRRGGSGLENREALTHEKTGKIAGGTYTNSSEHDRRPTEESIPETSVPPRKVYQRLSTDSVLTR